MKDEGQTPVRARLTWGDVAFGLEIARWRSQRLLNPSELLRRFFGIQRNQAQIARPGLLLIEVPGLTRSNFEAALKSGEVRFLQSLLSQEQYELLPLRSERELAPLVESVRTVLESMRGAGPETTQGLPRWNPSPEVWAGVELAAGWPLVHLRLATFQTSDRAATTGVVDQGGLGQIDRTMSRLYRKALLSVTADYEVWIVAEGPDGFALLPANTAQAHPGQTEVLEASTLATAVARLLALPGSGQNLNPIRSRPENTLRIMSYNIHSCVGLDGKLVPSRIARIIRGFGPDIVALQEVDLKRSRSKGEDQVARLARALSMDVAFCCTADRAWERYGHALLTRSPASVVAAGLFSGEEQRGEPRGALLAKIETAGRSIYIANTHFGLTARDRLRQAGSFLGSEWLGRIPADAPLIVCGDFNMRPGSPPYQMISQRLSDAQLHAKIRQGDGTFPSPMPIMRLDFVFVSNHFTVERVAVVRSRQARVASDHLPLVADLSF